MCIVLTLKHKQTTKAKLTQQQQTNKLMMRQLLLLRVTASTN